MDLRDVYTAGVDLRHAQLRPSGRFPALRQKIRHGVQHHQVGTVGAHQDVPHLFPDDAHVHEAAQEIPVGQGVLRPEGRPQAADGTLAVRVLSVQPVRQKEEQIPLRAVVAAQPCIRRLRNTRQAQQVQGLHLLLGAEEIRGGGDVPSLGLLRPVQDLGQQQPVVPRGAQAVQQMALIHGAAPGCGPAPRRRRSSPSVPRGCPVPRCGRPPPPRCGRRCGRWRGGGR